MARIRTIKPDFWTDEKVVELSMAARLLVLGSLNFADDNGNLERSPKKLKMQVFPADSIDCEPLIQEVITQGMFTEYSVNGKNYLHIKGFRKHQVINRPSKSNIPEPEFNDESGDAHGSLTETSLTEGKGKEGSKPTVPNGTDADASPGMPGNESGQKPSDGQMPTTKEQIWHAGKSLLMVGGTDKQQAGAFIGKLVRDYGEPAVLESVQAGVVEQPADPRAWLKAACQRIAGERKPGNAKPSMQTSFESMDYSAGFGQQ